MCCKFQAGVTLSSHEFERLRCLKEGSPVLRGSGVTAVGERETKRRRIPTEPYKVEPKDWLRLRLKWARLLALGLLPWT